MCDLAILVIAVGALVGFPIAMNLGEFIDLPPRSAEKVGLTIYAAIGVAIFFGYTSVCR